MEGRGVMIQDIRYAWRVWRKYPLVIVAAILSLGFGMGANTAVFSVLHAALLKTAAVREPGTISRIYSTSAASAGLHATSFQNYDDLRRAMPFAIAAAAPISIGLSSDGGQPEEVPAELVSDNYFRLLGVVPALGRLFAVSEGGPDGSSPVVVVSDALWRRRFAGRADAIGHKVSVNARPFTIIGVAPAGFASLDLMRAVDVWIPMAMHADALTGVQNFYFNQRWRGMFDLVARQEPPLTGTEARSLLMAQATALADTFPKENEGLGFETRALRQSGLNPAQRESWTRGGGLMGGVVALVLLIACVNVANLLLARSAARQREIAVRLALGASRRDLIRQLLIESFMLSLAGAAAGLLIAKGSLLLLNGMRPAFMPTSFATPIDGLALVFTGVMTVLTSLAFGLAPAFQSARQDVVNGLKNSRALVRRTSGGDFGRLLLVVQSTLATVALVLAALFLRSLHQAQTLDTGFDRQNLVVVGFDLGMLRYDNTRGPALVRQVNERMAATPGVVASAVSSHAVLDGAALASKIRLAGQPDAEAQSVHAQAVGLQYFKTMGIPLLEGRTFRETDTESPFGWAIVNKTLARQLWPGQPAIGQRFQLMGIKEPYEVVGLAADSQYESLGEATQPYFYIFYDQTPGLKKLTLFVRTTGDPRALQSTIEQGIRAVDPNLPLLSVRTMSEVMEKAMWVPRTGSALLMLFGAMSLTLAAIGIYGVTAFFVRQQVRDIAIRTALGASRFAILVPLMRWTFAPTLAGIALGLIVATLIGRLLGNFLIGIAPTDIASFASASSILGLVAAAASVLPALGATRLDPSSVLRGD
jgi:predicted permease